MSGSSSTTRRIGRAARRFRIAGPLSYDRSVCPMARKRVTDGAVASEALASSFPRLNLPIAPPFPPMEAATADQLPTGSEWAYEPKWDGFRCLAFRDGDTLALQSKAGQPLGRYFPELVSALKALPTRSFVLDGEIVIIDGQQLAFDDLLQRIHPAESRILKLAAELPATYLAFDLLLDGDGTIVANRPLDERRSRLDAFFARHPPAARIQLSPTTTAHEVATAWMRELGAAGLDGVIAKRRSVAYRSGERDGMLKVKRIRTADCIVAGFRHAQKSRAI